MRKSLNILVVDDEPAIRQILVATLKKADYTADSAKDGVEALFKLEKDDFDLVISDINMPEMDGIELVKQSKERGYEVVFLMMTAYASVDTAVKAMKAGAFDYLTKPLRREDILHRLEQVSSFIGLKAQNRTLKEMVQKEEEGKCRLISPGMTQVERLIRKVATTDFTVFISGGSGTGKGVVARQIHKNSQRKEGLFIPVNCGSIPENLLESEFFGHVKGAFTGADKAKKGLFQEADKGTLFLDEIGELPLNLQVKLLHVLEENKIRPVGSEQFRNVDTRIISATNRKLEDMVAAGTFREDLFFRLNVFNIPIPPLRERPEDVPLLIRYFLEQRATKAGTNSPFAIDPDAEAAMQKHDWPGNIRELENVIERALILAEDGVITLNDLPQNIAAKVSTSISGINIPESGETLRDKIRDYEIKVILDTIEKADGDRKVAASSLGIGLSSLYRKLEQANLPNLFSD
ncbi:MAG: sigma-54-dependent Fis family transcriptional regulator [Magnetococcales bacterium]|nr:sigma-54-dependent Fis family transcriptional regulator [Magnetococcales bacterium]